MLNTTRSGRFRDARLHYSAHRWNYFSDNLVFCVQIRGTRCSWIGILNSCTIHWLAILEDVIFLSFIWAALLLSAHPVPSLLSSIALVLLIPLICMSSSRLTISSECKSPRMGALRLRPPAWRLNLTPCSNIASNSCAQHLAIPFESFVAWRQRHFNTLWFNHCDTPLLFSYKELRLFAYGSSTTSNFGDKIQWACSPIIRLVARGTGWNGR